MAIPRSWMLTLAITAVVVLWMLSGIFVSTENTQPETVTAAGEIPKVRVQQSIAQAMTNRLVLQGQTRADRRVDVKAETHGVVKQTFIDKGSVVSEGTELIKLALEDRQARVLEARSLLAERKIEYQGVKSLKKSGFQAETELARAKAALDSATAALHMAELELKRINIAAPISGIVDNRFVEVGDFVNRGDPLVVIVDLDPIRVVAQISERYLGQIKTDKEGEVRLLDGKIVPAKVTYVGAAASENTRTFPVEMQIPNPDSVIIEGVTAELHLPIEQVLAHKVPPSVLSLLDNGELSVKTVNADNHIVAYPIQILGDSDNGIWLGGLPDEVTLVVVGHEFVLPNQSVVPVTVDSLKDVKTN